MSVEERISDLGNEIQQIKDYKRDVWDKMLIIVSMLVSLTLACDGGFSTYVSQNKTKKEVVARVQRASGSKIKYAEQVSNFFESLTGLKA